jgi:hypothetical protein
MQLRTHPLMNYRGISNGRPSSTQWKQPEEQRAKTLGGEIGMLTYVSIALMASLSITIGLQPEFNSTVISHGYASRHAVS